MIEKILVLPNRYQKLVRCVPARTHALATRYTVLHAAYLLDASTLSVVRSGLLAYVHRGSPALRYGNEMPRTHVALHPWARTWNFALRAQGPAPEVHSAASILCVICMEQVSSVTNPVHIELLAAACQRYLNTS